MLIKAEQTLSDANGMAEVAAAQEFADKKAANVALATAEDAMRDAIDQAKTDFSKTRDRPGGK